MGTPSLPFHWRIKFKFWPGVFSWRKLRATCRTSQVGLCISGQHVCPFLKVLHRCTLCEAPHRVSHYHVVAAAFQSFILPCCLRGTWQSWFVRLHVWPPFQLELRARWIFRRRLKATILWLPRRLFVLHTLPGTHEKSRPSLNAYPFARRYGKRQEILTWKETLHGIAQCQRRHRNCKTSVETGSYSEAVFSRDFFLAPAFSLNFGLWRFTRVFSFLPSTVPFGVLASHDISPPWLAVLVLCVSGHTCTDLSV